MIPLYGHTTLETAYMVNDYPYGGMRCRIRFWLESSPTKGFRFCSQTENPKNLRWNTPKKSTYVKIAAGMFLDEKGHCTWTGISEYADAKKCAEFLNNFKDQSQTVLRNWCKNKARFNRRLISGEVGFTINGERREYSEEEKARLATEAKEWEALSVFPE